MPHLLENRPYNMQQFEDDPLFVDHSFSPKMETQMHCVMCFGFTLRLDWILDM